MICHAYHAWNGMHSYLRVNSYTHTRTNKLFGHTFHNNNRKGSIRLQVDDYDWCWLAGSILVNYDGLAAS